MIVHFPPPYDDELLYSWLARFYAKSGYMAYTLAAEDLFTNKHSKPNIEFVTELTSSAIEAIERYMPRTELIEKHTMYPYFARFLGKDRRYKGFDALVRMDKSYLNLICLSKNKNGTVRNLRYCPLCAAEDRKDHGEAYWHRAHQLIGIVVCPRHRCRLAETDIPINSKGSPSLIIAEEIISEKSTAISDENALELEIAQYVTSVFQQPVDMETDIPVGVFLNSRLEGTKYLSQRGEKRNIQLLYDDYQARYHDLSSVGELEIWQLQKIFNSKRHNTYEICLLAFMLNISPADLAYMTLPVQSQAQRFDEQIKALHNQGLNYRQIADELNASYDVVKSIGEGLYGTYHYRKPDIQQCGTKGLDWEELDRESLPKVKKILCDLQDASSDKPVKISVRRIEKILGWPNKRLQRCPTCLKEVKHHMLTQEEYWIELVDWAVNQLISEGKQVNITGIMRLTNMRKRDFERIGMDLGYKV